MSKPRKKKSWISKAIKHPGALHQMMGVPLDETIPLADLEAAAKKPGLIGTRARFALALRRMHKGRK